MKHLPLLFLASLLCVACPKKQASTSNMAVDPAATMTSFAIFIADAEGVAPPSGARVEASGSAGSLLLVEAPALMIDRPPEGWRRWARIGDATARARLGGADWLLSDAAAGKEASKVTLTLSEAGTRDPEIRLKLQSSGVAVHDIAGEAVSATVPKGAWGAVLKMVEVASVAPEG